MKKYAEKFYHSSAWAKSRNAFIAERIKIDGGLCERCRKELGYIVHHKKHLSPDNIDDADISLNSENFEYLCKACHDAEHEKEIFGGKKKKLLCRFDGGGNPIE